MTFWSEVLCLFGFCLFSSSSNGLTFVFPEHLAKDQNFHRTTWTKRDPSLCPCLLPGGKYVVSARWSLLQPQARLFETLVFNGFLLITGGLIDSSDGWFEITILAAHWQERMKLQGVGMDEYRRYGMSSLKPRQLADLAGNSCLGLIGSLI